LGLLPGDILELDSDKYEISLEPGSAVRSL